MAGAIVNSAVIWSISIVMTSLLMVVKAATLLTLPRPVILQGDRQKGERQASQY